jgi:hypothetical protein
VTDESCITHWIGGKAVTQRWHRSAQQAASYSFPTAQ